MSRRTRKQQIARVVTFMMGLTDPRIATALRPHGLTDRELRHAHQLLLRAMGTTLPPAHPTFDRATLVRALDDWENTWLHVADVVLGIHFPQIHTELFLNVTRQSDTTVILTVDTFLRRLEALSQRTNDEPGVAEALALLHTRGLTPARIDTAQDLLDQLRTVLHAHEPNDGGRAERDGATRALWTWFKEWSALARTAVRDKGQLRALGFGT